MVLAKRTSSRGWRVVLAVLVGASILSLFTAACSDDGEATDGGAADGASDRPGNDGGGGAGGTGASGGSGGSGGKGGSGGSAGSGMGGGGSDGGADAGQPLGAFCVMSSQCDPSEGAVVCCTLPGCGGPCGCALEAQCPGGTMFLPCSSSKDCEKFGGGKICCEQTSGGTTVRFCTKKSACGGKELP